MRKVVLATVFAALIAVGTAGYFQVAAYNKHSAAETEIKTQKAEAEKCKQNLALFYQAWKNYKADHKGAEPKDIGVLIPKYIPDPALLVCPTAQRWINNHKDMDHGSITINKQSYMETYGFQWLTCNAPRDIKRQGDKAPLITCTAHEEGIYLAIFHKKPRIGAFDDGNRQGYVGELQNVRPLAVRRNGVVEELSAGEQ